jgi:hypothetical protein
VIRETAEAEAGWQKVPMQREQTRARRVIDSCMQFRLPQKIGQHASKSITCSARGRSRLQATVPKRSHLPSRDQYLSVPVLGCVRNPPLDSHHHHQSLIYCYTPGDSPLSLALHSRCVVYSSRLSSLALPAASSPMAMITASADASPLASALSIPRRSTSPAHSRFRPVASRRRVLTHAPMPLRSCSLRASLGLAYRTRTATESGRTRTPIRTLALPMSTFASS